MSTIYLRNIPEKVVETLKQLAKENNQSLNSYLIDRLTEIAAKNENAEVISELRSRAEKNRGKPSKISTDDIVAMIRADREAAANKWKTWEEAPLASR